MNIKCETCRHISLKRWNIKGEGEEERAKKYQVGPAWPGTGTCMLFWKAVMLNGSETCWRPKPNEKPGGREDAESSGEDSNAIGIFDMANRAPQADNPWVLACRRVGQSGKVSQDTPIKAKRTTESPR